MGKFFAGCAAVALLATPALAEAPRTSEEASQANLQGAIMAPVRDLNLVRDEAPEVLTNARDAPYLDPQTASCAQLAEMIAPLDKALGPDRGDGHAPPKAGAGAMVLGAVADVTRDIIPFRGVVRRVTGAARNDQKIRETREAGQLRRAYLKGFASAKNCYGPPQPKKVQVAQEAVQPTALPPVAVASLEAPPPVATVPAPPPPTPQPRFVLPESWVTQISATRAY